MTNLIKADFNGTQVLFKNNAYLNATVIAKAFGKQPKDYLRNERTKEYINALMLLLNSKRQNSLLTENQLVIKQHGGGSNKGTWLHPKLAIDFARWLSAEFAVWCDEQIETILHNKISQPKLDDLSTVQSREPLAKAVVKLVAVKHINYSDAWKIVHQWVGVDKASNMTDSDVEKGLRYVHGLTVGNSIEGELLPKEEAAADSQEKGITLMAFGGMVERVQHDKLRKARAMLNEATSLLNDASDCSGAIYDGFHESSMHFTFSNSDREAGQKKANKMFKNWKMSKRIF